MRITPSDLDRIQHACVETDVGLMRPEWMDDFLRDKSRYYRTFHIPKRELQKRISAGYKPPYSPSRIPSSEKHLWRKISAPVRCLREFQEKILAVLYRRKPSKFDYCVKRRNRYMANEEIAGKSIIVAADIQDAFPSTDKWKIMNALRREGFPENIVELICDAATDENDSLPQGSPCSPVLLNLCRKKLDYRLEGFIRKQYGGVMVVYVDNYYFASDNPKMNKSIPILKRIASREGYQFPDKKIYVMRKGNRQGGLGLVASINQDGEKVVQPPKEKKIWLRGILHMGLKRAGAGDRPWHDMSISQVRGIVECFRGSKHYNGFKLSIEQIERAMNGEPAA